jgi:hypothetical protein
MKHLDDFIEAYFYHPENENFEQHFSLFVKGDPGSNWERPPQLLLPHKELIGNNDELWYRMPGVTYFFWYECQYAELRDWMAKDADVHYERGKFAKGSLTFEQAQLLYLLEPYRS